MKISHPIGNLFVVLWLFLGIAPRAPADDQAAIMPLADQSLLLDLAISGSRLLAAGERGHILYSDDGGGHWRQARVPTRQMLTSIFFIDDRRGWAAGHDGLILASDDAGETWRIQRNGLIAQQQLNLELREAAHRAVIRLQNAVDDAAPGADTSELETALEDAMLDLDDAELALREPPYAPPLMDIWFQDAEHGWAVGAFGTLLATRDGGLHWSSDGADLENPEENHLNAVVGDGTGRVFIAGEGGVMFRSPDGGKTWEPLPSAYDGSWFGAVYSPAQESLLVFGLRGRLYRSRDFGSHWQAVASGVEMTLAGGTAASTGEVVIVGAVGTILYSDDGGSTFTGRRLTQRPGLSAGLRWRDALVLAGQGGLRRLPLAEPGT